MTLKEETLSEKRSIAGKLGSRENKIKAGKLGYIAQTSWREKHPNLGIKGIFRWKKENPELYKKSLIKGGKNSIKIRKKRGTYHNEQVKAGINSMKGREMGKIYFYNNIGFRSKEEIEIYKFLKSKNIIFEYSIKIDRFEFDFLLSEFKLFIEHHPFVKRFDSRNSEKYFKDRREILDFNGYKDFNLIVTKNLKSAKNILEVFS